MGLILSPFLTEFVVNLLNLEGYYIGLVKTRAAPAFKLWQKILNATVDMYSEYFC